MSSSRRCTVNKCSRSCRVICNCCQQSFCLDHLKEHTDRLNDQITPLTDQFNQLSEQIKHLSFTETSFIYQLDQWRVEAHRTVDQFHLHKLEEYAKSFDECKEKQRNKLQRIGENLKTMLTEQDASEENIRSVQQIFHTLQEQITSLHNPHVVFTSLVIDPHLIKLPSRNLSKDLLPLPPPSYTINREKNSPFSIASNNNSILLCQTSKLCLLNEQLQILKEVPWTDNQILDMFFSTALNRFLIITLEDIFHLHAETMTLTKCPTLTEKTSADQWYCGTSFNEILFLSKSSAGSSLYQYQLIPTMEFTKEWQSPLSCSANEFIDDLRSNEYSLAVIIFDETNKETRLELRSPKTLSRKWTMKITSAFRTYRCRCCSLINEQWFITDGKNSRLLHIDRDGILIKQDKYEPKPRHCLQLDEHRMIISTETNLNLHQLTRSIIESSSTLTTLE